MTTQPRFWGHADTATRQPTLFDTEGPPALDLRCDCGAYLERTPGGYLACPKGHGRLREAVQVETPGGFWDDLTAEVE